MYVVFDGAKKSIGRAESNSTKQNVMTSWLSIVFLLTFVAFGACAVTSLLNRFDILSTETPVEEAFRISNVLWVAYFVAISAIPLLFICTVMEIEKTLTSVTKLCADGVFIIQGEDSDLYVHFKVVIAIFTVVMMTVCAIIFNITDLILVSSLTSLIRGAMATFVTLLLRFRVPELYARSPIRFARKGSVTLARTSHSSEGYGTLTGNSGPSTPKDESELYDETKQEKPATPNG